MPDVEENKTVDIDTSGPSTEIELDETQSTETETETETPEVETSSTETEEIIDVVEASDDDNTVCKTLRNLNPHIFANGGDRGNKNTPEMAVCKELDIQMVWGMGGNDKPQSSSWLIDAIKNKAENEK